MRPVVGVDATGGYCLNSKYGPESRTTASIYHRGDRAATLQLIIGLGRALSGDYAVRRIWFSPTGPD